MTTPSMYAREYGRTMHKRSTIELLLRGKAGPMAATRETPGDQVREPPPATMMIDIMYLYQVTFSHPHRFERYNYTTPTYCDICNSVLWGPVKTGVRCQVNQFGENICGILENIVCRTAG